VINLSDYSIRTVPTFIDGVLIAGNAIKDAMVVFRGGACIFEHVHQTFEDHDYTQNYISHDARGRLLITYSDSSSYIMGTEKDAESFIREGINKLKPKVIILSELSMITVSGEDIKQFASYLSEKYRIPVIPATSLLLTRDFRDAYESILSGLAESIKESCFRKSRSSPCIGITGLLYERGEGDWEGNVIELSNIIKSIGLKTVCPWLSGSDYKSLTQIAGATHVVAFPFGEKSSEILKKRSRAEILHSDLPVGIGGTVKWIRMLGEAASHEREAEEYIKTQVEYVIQRLNRVVTRFLAGKRCAVFAMADWLKVLPEFFEQELGIETAVSILRHRFPVSGMTGSAEGYERNFDPGVRTVNFQLKKACEKGKIDFIIGSSWEKSILDREFEEIPFLEFGYPNRNTHYLLSSPFVGFNGTLNWANRITDLLIKV
jgi:nitrogenase molybdenum-iron protein alpha/beta subunit